MTHVPVMPAEPRPQGVCPDGSGAGLLGRLWATTQFTAGGPGMGTCRSYPASRLVEGLQEHLIWSTKSSFY